MDLGLYNKGVTPRGDHGTMIGNWVEERALQQFSGHTRRPGYEDTIEGSKTKGRIVEHTDNRVRSFCHFIWNLFLFEQTTFNHSGHPR